jgi:hypothetical protein
MIVAPDAKGVHFTTDDPGEMVETGLTELPIGGRFRAVDHAAMVVESAAEVDRMIQALVDRGGQLVEGPYLFPDDVCDTEVPADLKKVMGTVALATGLLVVSAPASPGDQLGRHLATWGSAVPHHVALYVDDVTAAAPAWAAAGYRVGPITDDGTLGQVFMASPEGQIVELISRRSPTHDTWSCANVAALSAAENALRGVEAGA